MMASSLIYSVALLCQANTAGGNTDGNAPSYFLHTIDSLVKSSISDAIRQSSIISELWISSLFVAEGLMSDTNIDIAAPLQSRLGVSDTVSTIRRQISDTIDGGNDKEDLVVNSVGVVVWTRTGKHVKESDSTIMLLRQGEFLSRELAGHPDLTAEIDRRGSLKLTDKAVAVSCHFLSFTTLPASGKGPDVLKLGKASEIACVSVHMQNVSSFPPRSKLVNVLLANQDGRWVMFEE